MSSSNWQDTHATDATLEPKLEAKWPLGLGRLRSTVDATKSESMHSGMMRQTTTQYRIGIQIQNCTRDHIADAMHMTIHHAKTTPREKLATPTRHVNLSGSDSNRFHALVELGDLQLVRQGSCSERSSELAKSRISASLNCGLPVVADDPEGVWEIVHSPASVEQHENPLGDLSFFSSSASFSILLSGSSRDATTDLSRSPAYPPGAMAPIAPSWKV